MIDDMEKCFKVDPKTTGLLVVDVQEKLLPFIDNHQEVVKRVCQSIEVAGYLEMPIYVTEQYVKGLGPTVPKIKAALKQFDAYKPFEKFPFSCLGDEDFADHFEHADLETLAVVGIEAHICVMQTTLDVIEEGIDVFLIGEAIGSRNPEHKKEAIERMRYEGATIGSVEMFAFEAMRTAKHPAFKKVQKVIL